VAGTGPDGAWTEAVRLAIIPKETNKKRQKERKRQKGKGKMKWGK